MTPRYFPPIDRQHPRGQVEPRSILKGIERKRELNRLGIRVFDPQRFGAIVAAAGETEDADYDGVGAPIVGTKT
jgi:hypothetical protein